MDSRTPRDGKAIEELGYYDPMVPEKDARAVLNGERIAHWLGVGATPSDKVAVLIKKYGQDGTHLEKQQAALERMKNLRSTRMTESQKAAEAAAKANAEAKAKAEEEEKAKAEEEAKAKAEEEAKAAAEAEAAASGESEATEGGEAEAGGDAAEASAEAPEAEGGESAEG